MNSTIDHRPKYSILMIVAIAYIAGLGTYHLIQHNDISGKLDAISLEIMSNGDTLGTDTTKAGTLCPCDNIDRYNVSPTQQSNNVPIPLISQCSTMVHAGNPGPGTIVGAGAWFSKITLDNMFCHKPDANGIFVYKAQTDDRQIAFVIEAARNNAILSTDDGVSYIYYSRAMCPPECGSCW